MLDQKKTIFPSGRAMRLAGMAAVLAAATLLGACARQDMQMTGGIPDDYRTRHPISLAEAEHTLDVPLAAGEHGLTPATRDLITGFAQDYAALSKGVIQVALPVGAANSATASRLRGQIRKVLVSAGIPSSRILYTSYGAQGGDVSAPVRLSFVAVTAVTPPCGQWPTDLVTGPSVIRNTNYENFGCASQQNLAAQIANPTDLVGPRGMSPIDAQNRSTVIDTYRNGDSSSDTSE